jgi:CheY-like chemotaxis protein
MDQSTNQPAHVLVVDDAEENRFLIEVLLGSEGYSVDAAASGGEALQRVEEHRPDVVVLDLSLPDMNGGDLMDQFTRQGMDSPVCIVTGDISPRSRLTVQRAAAYLMKPYDVEALLRTVSELAGCGALTNAGLAG